YTTGIAATQSAGLQQNRGTMCKSFHAGRAAASGVLSALMAARGFDSASDILDGKQGFCRIYGVESKPAALTDMLGRRWAIESNGHKPYSCAIGLHPVIDAMIEIRATADLDPEKITRVELRAHPYLSKYQLLDNPVNGLHAKFSAYHSAAVALIDGAAGVVQFTDARVSDPAVAELRRKVHLTLDDSLGMDQAYARIVAGNVDYEATIDHAMGSVENPMTDAAIQAKFDANATPGLGAERTRRVSESIWNLESLPDVRDLVALCA
ncbi:MAG: MmgE/PrpD family protein, partial [Betaproteobacteria bacterium]|nr:MmgE/PrpD family protein [Betaproteobacteria bacterium]